MFAMCTNCKCFRFASKKEKKRIETSSKSKDSTSEDNNPPIVTEKGFEVGDQIANGGFSNVYEAFSTHDDKADVAVKIMRFAKLDKQWKESKLMDELKISKKLNHENIIKVYGVIKTEHRAFIFMERAKYSLDNYIRKNYGRKLPDKVAKTFFRQAVNGVAFLHSKGLAHRGNLADN